MNKFYKGYESIAASPEFKSRMVKTLQSAEKESASNRSGGFVIKKRTLAILIAAVVALLAIGTAAAATILARNYYSPSSYMMHGKDEREQNQNVVPDIESAIASAKPETGNYSIVMLPEMENADELNEWRQKMGQPVYSEEDWGWIREIRPEIEEVLLDGNTLICNIRMHTDHGMNFNWESEHAVEGLSEESYYTVDGDDTIHELPFGGGGTNPSSVTADGATMHAEFDLDELAEPFPTDGKVHVTTTIHIRDVHVDDMNDVGLLALMTYSFTFDASAGADVAAPIVTERALSGSVVLTCFDKNGERNVRVSLDGVVLEETLKFRKTGIYATYRVKSAPDTWTEAYTNALLSPSPESGNGEGMFVACVQKNGENAGAVMQMGYPSSIPFGEYTFILPIFPSDYAQAKKDGYTMQLNYRCVDTFNGEPVGDDWNLSMSGSGVMEYNVTTRVQPLASFDLILP